MKKETKKRGYRKGYSKHLYLFAGKRLLSETETGGIRDGDFHVPRIVQTWGTTIGNGDLMNKGSPAAQGLETGIRDIEKEDGEDRIFQGVNRLAKISSVI